MVNSTANSTLNADFSSLIQLYDHFFTARTTADWNRPTQLNGKGWTLHQTIAHLAAVAKAYNQFMQSALSATPLVVEGISNANDLGNWNTAQIALREAQPISAVCTEFLNELTAAQTTAATLTPDDLQKTIPFPAYNRPITVDQLLAGQLGHPGLVHAAQVAIGAGIPPLWTQYETSFLHRQLSRTFALMSLAYRIDRGGPLDAIVHFKIRRQPEAAWYLHLAPNGGSAGPVAASPRKPNSTLYLSDMDTLCGLFTLQIKPVQAVLKGRVFVWGNPTLPLRLASLCNPV